MFKEKPVRETISYFYWNSFKLTAFWGAIIIIPAVVVVMILSYEYLSSGFITRWRLSRILNIVLFIMVPAGALLNTIVMYHLYKLIINIDNNFYTYYKLDKGFSDFFFYSVGFALKITLPILVLSYLVGSTDLLVSPLAKLTLILILAIVFEAIASTYGLTVVARVNETPNTIYMWGASTAFQFFKANWQQVLKYAISATALTIVSLLIYLLLIQLSSIIGLIYSLFSTPLILVCRGAMHANLLAKAGS